jgi:hypothetical protein
MSVECEFNQEFDPKYMYQYVNNEISVMHCHHYATLFTKLAIDMDKKLDGARLLKESMEESAYLTLQRLMLTQKVISHNDKVDIAQQYFGLSGLGQLQLKVKSNGGSARLMHSHVDEGWIKKWRKEKKPVNFIGQGYIIAAFSVINGRSIGTYEIEETRSIVKGDRYSEFTITEKR